MFPESTSEQVAARTRPTWRRRLGRLSAGLGVGLAAVVLIVALTGRGGPSGTPNLLGHPTFSMLSGSMSPVIRTGDLVIDRSLSPAQSAELRVGQIITFRSSPGSRKLFTHRIVNVQRGPDGVVTYTTKGDANNAPDANPVPAADVVGLYSMKVPDGGYVLNALRRPSFLLVLFLVPVLLGVSVSLVRRARWEVERAPGAADTGPAWS